MNEVKIDGILCNKKEAYTQSGKCITTFGLNFYNGKNKEGKATYEFLDCKMFEKTPFTNKDRVNVSGWLCVDSWEKDGKTYKKVVILVKNIEKQAIQPADDETDIPF